MAGCCCGGLVPSLGSSDWTAESALIRYPKVLAWDYALTRLHHEVGTSKRRAELVETSLPLPQLNL